MPLEDVCRVSVPMLLSMNIAGLPNVGADVGGFFGNPELELLQRWYQAAIFYPFLELTPTWTPSVESPGCLGTRHLVE